MIEILDVLFYATLFLTSIAAYLFFFRKKDGFYARADIFYPIKYFFAKQAVERARKARTRPPVGESCQKITSKTQSDSLLICGVNDEGDDVIIELTFHGERVAHLFLRLSTGNGEVFQLTDDSEQPLWRVKEYQWRVGGATVEILEPFKRLSVTYRGRLYEKRAKVFKKASIRFIWNASGAPFNRPLDSDAGLLAEAIATERWRDGDWLRHLGDGVGYEQYGVLHGIFESDRSREFRFSSWRRRHYGTSPDQSLHRDFFVFGVTESGLLFNLGAVCLKNGCSRLKYGTVQTPDGAVGAIQDSDICLARLGENGVVPRCFAIKFRAKNKRFRCAIYSINSTKIANNFRSQDGCSAWDLSTAYADCQLNLEKAAALVYSWREAAPPAAPETNLQENAMDFEHFWHDYELQHEFDTAQTFDNENQAIITAALAKSTIFQAIPGVKIKGDRAIYEYKTQPLSQSGGHLLFALLRSARGLMEANNAAKIVRRATKSADLGVLPYDSVKEMVAKANRAAKTVGFLFGECLKAVGDAAPAEKEALVASLLKEFTLYDQDKNGGSEEFTGKLRAKRQNFYGKRTLIGSLSKKLVSDLDDAALQVRRDFCGEVFALLCEIRQLYAKIGRKLAERAILKTADHVFHATKNELRHLAEGGGESAVFAERAARRAEIFRLECVK